LAQRILLYVANDSDNLSRRFPKKCQSDVLSDRIVVGPKTPGYGFTDEHHGRPAHNIGIIQVATAQQRDAHSAQVAWRDDTNVNFRLIRHRHDGLSFPRRWAGASRRRPAASCQSKRRTGCLAWREAVPAIGHKSGPPRGGVENLVQGRVAPPSKRYWVKTGPNAAELQQSAQHQSGADQ